MSLAVALVFTPAFSLILLRGAKLERQESPLVRVLKRGYDRALAPIVRTPRPAYLAVGVIAIAGIAVLPFLGESLFPSFKERDFLIHWVTAPGTSLPEEDRINMRLSNELRSIPGVRTSARTSGRPCWPTR